MEVTLHISWVDLLLATLLFASATVRVNLVSAVYLIVGLGHVLLSISNVGSTIKRWRTRLTRLLLIGSIVALAGLISSQAILAAHKPYGSLLGPDDGHTARLWRQIGVSRLDLPAIHVLRLILPDIFVAIASFLLVRESFFPSLTRARRSGLLLRFTASIRPLIVPCTTVLSWIIAACIPGGLAAVHILISALLFLPWGLTPRDGTLHRSLIQLSTAASVGSLILIYAAQFEGAETLSHCLLGAFGVARYTEWTSTPLEPSFAPVPWPRWLQPGCLFVLLLANVRARV